jgi:hypothetical protein
MASSGEQFVVLLLLFLVAASTGNAHDLVGYFNRITGNNRVLNRG